MKLPLGGEAGRQAIGGEREEIKKLPTTPPSALTATPLPSQHIISGRKEKHGRCSNNSPIRSLVYLSCLSNAALLCCNKKNQVYLLIFKNCQFPLFHIPCTTPAPPAKKADSNSYTHRFSIKQRRC